MIRAKKAIFAALAAIVFSGIATAQEQSMSLDALLAAADSGSVQLRAARSGIASARERMASVDRNTLTPDLRISASVGYLGDGYGWGRDSSYSFTVPMPHFSTRFGLEAQQVIYAGGATQAARQQAAIGVKLSELEYAQRRQDVRLQLVGHYLDLYRSRRQLEVYDSNIALTTRLIDDIRAKHEQGTALKNDLTRYELQLASLQMHRTKVENDMHITNSMILTLAGLPSGTVVVPDSGFLDNLDMSLTVRHETPLAVQITESMIDMSAAEEQRERAAMLPYIALVAQDELTGPVTIDITPYNINYNYWFVGIALNYNLSSLWKSNRSVQSARHQLEQRQLEHEATTAATRQALEAATIRLEEAHKKHAIKQKSLALAEENYALVANRYAADLALLVDMLDAANQKLAAELDLIGARLNVAYRRYMIDYINGKL